MQHGVIIPRYNAASVTKFAFLVLAGTPGTVDARGTPAVEGQATFPTGWFSSREWPTDGWLNDPTGQPVRSYNPRGEAAC